MISNSNIKFKSSLKYTLLIGVIGLLAACSIGSKLVKPNVNAILEKLSNQLVVSLPKGYEGIGYHNSGDAPGFKKQKIGGKIRLSFEDIESFGGALQTFSKNKMPNELKGFSNSLKMGNDKVYFYNSNNGMNDLNSHGVLFFLFDQQYKEVLYVNYQSGLQSEVETILKTVKLSVK